MKYYVVMLRTQIVSEDPDWIEWCLYPMIVKGANIDNSMTKFVEYFLEHGYIRNDQWFYCGGPDTVEEINYFLYKAKDIIIGWDYTYKEITGYDEWRNALMNINQYHLDEQQYYPYISTDDKLLRKSINSKWITQLTIYNYILLKYPDAQYNVRPSYLHGLEYDIYIPSLHIAIEYQGRQHYEYVPFFHNNNIENFYKQQKRDKEKMRLSLLNKITLKYITYKDIITQELIENLLN